MGLFSRIGNNIHQNKAAEVIKKSLTQFESRGLLDIPNIPKLKGRTDLAFVHSLLLVGEFKKVDADYFGKVDGQRIHKALLAAGALSHGADTVEYEQLARIFFLAVGNLIAEIGENSHEIVSSSRDMVMYDDIIAGYEYLAVKLGSVEDEYSVATSTLMDDDIPY